MEIPSREYNIYYRPFLGLLIYLLSTRVDLCFAVHNLEKFPSDPGKVHFEGLVHLLRYIRYNKNLGLRYYSKIEDALLSEILIQASIRTEKQSMVFSAYICKDCQDTGISTGAYVVFYQGGAIDHCTHVPGPVSQSSAES